MKVVTTGISAKKLKDLKKKFKIREVEVRLVPIDLPAEPDLRNDKKQKISKIFPVVPWTPRIPAFTKKNIAENWSKMSGKGPIS